MRNKSLSVVVYADVILLFNALALGASAVGVGQPIHYGPAVGGAPGVTSVLNALNTELKLAMKLAGCATISDITEKYVHPA